MCEGWGGTLAMSHQVQVHQSRDHQTNLDQFAQARLGLFVHLGLYSMLGRGEWVLNKEQIPIEKYQRLAQRFDPVDFDADALARLAVQAGAKYLCFTTMHHEGFALYDSDVNPFCSARMGAKRDLVEEVVSACRRHGLRVHLYHSLNHWTHQPDAVDALERDDAYEAFIEFTHERIRELVTRFDPIDCLWYDGWWPFNAEGWQAQAMNDMVRSIQPHVLFNGRNGLPGDFATPEGHITAPQPYRAWEACMTHNDSWGYHAGDSHFKSAAEVIAMVIKVAAGAGNLLINVGPEGSGRIPEPSVRMLEQVGQWMETNGESIYGSEPMTLDPLTRGNHRSDFILHGQITARDHTLYLHLLRWPGCSFSMGGLESIARSVRWLGQDDRDVTMTQSGTRLTFNGLPECAPNALPQVLAIECDEPPTLYMTGGMRVPRVEHPRYDPCPSDIEY